MKKLCERDMSKRLNEIIDVVIGFRDARDWKQFHDRKNLAEAISIESGELLEKFLWITTDESRKVDNVKLEKIKEEISDIFIYIIYLCSTLNFDLLNKVENKIAINQKRYPLKDSKWSNKKYTEL